MGLNDMGFFMGRTRRYGVMELARPCENHTEREHRSHPLCKELSGVKRLV